MKHIGTYIRLALEAIIVAEVWRHAHWSVAAALTGLTIHKEASDYVYEKLKKVSHSHDPITNQPTPTRTN